MPSCIIHIGHRHTSLQIRISLCISNATRVSTIDTSLLLTFHERGPQAQHRPLQPLSTLPPDSCQGGVVRQHAIRLHLSDAPRVALDGHRGQEGLAHNLTGRQ